MIVKKMPILQGFPDLETAIFLSNSVCEFSDNKLFFYDIETTGLSKSASFIYLIGAAAYENNCSILYQWFAESADEEQLILQEFSAFVRIHSHAIQYNGDRFDQPFLEARYQRYALPSPFEGITSLDLYRYLKKCQPLLKLAGMKQPNLEAFLGIRKRTHCDGGECIRLYRKHLKTKEPCLLDTVLGHNEEDLLGLGKIVSMLGYLALFDGNYSVRECRIINFSSNNPQIDNTFSYNKTSAYDNLPHMPFTEKLLVTLQLSFPVPIPVSNGNEQFYLQLKGKQARLLIPIQNGRLQQFYNDYRQYVYLPNEDSCIPKSLASFMDRSLYQPATTDTCYTWFPCNEEFVRDSGKVIQYLKHALPHFLQTLK